MLLERLLHACRMTLDRILSTLGRFVTSCDGMLLQIFLHACGMTLDRMPTTPEQDERLLREQTDLPQRMHDSIHLRLGHKRLLQGCIAQAEAALFFLDTVHQAALQPRKPAAPALDDYAEL